MNFDQEFISYVTERNIKEIRDWLWTRIAAGGILSKKFEEELEYCKSKGILYESHDGRNVNLQATKENYNELAGQLRTNFSKERLDALRKMENILHPQKTTTPEHVIVSQKTETNTNIANQQSNARQAEVPIEKKKSAGSTGGKFSISRILWFLFGVIAVIFLLIWLFGGFESFWTNTSNESFWTNTSNW